MCVIRKEISQIDALVYVATQSITAHPHFHLKRKGDSYLLTQGKTQLDINGLTLLVNNILQGSSDCQTRPIVYRALKCLSLHLEKQMRIGCLQRLWWIITCQTEKRLQNLERCKALHEIVKLKIAEFNDAAEINSELAARCEFTLRFKKLFKCTPRPFLKGEAILVDTLSKRIWNSKNVQEVDEQQKYSKYEELMTELYVGSHMLFEEARDESIIRSLYAKVNPKKRLLKKGHIEERLSSHYVPRREKQLHIRGDHIPEALFYKGVFERHKESIVTCRYARDAHKINHFKAFWIQTERTPNGPNFISLIKHNLVDFIQYFFLKYILRHSRPQIAHYIGPKGRGVPDTNPIIIKLNDTISS